MNGTERGPLPEAEITGGGLRLRPWDPDAAQDVDAWLRGVTDPGFQQWNTPLRSVVDLTGAHLALRARNQERVSGTALAFCVTDEVSGTVLGHLAFNCVDPVMRTARVGYWTLPEARGRGTASGALALATPWAFRALGLYRLELGHAVGHDASCAVARRCGYTEEGVLRGAMFKAGDRTGFRDVHLHARLADD